jgi:hypothetical protein
MPSDCHDDISEAATFDSLMGCYYVIQAVTWSPNSIDQADLLERAVDGR